MKVHYAPAFKDGYAMVVSVHDATRMLTPPPNLPFIEIDESSNIPLYYDILMHPHKYLVNEAGELFVDEDWSEDETI